MASSHDIPAWLAHAASDSAATTRTPAAGRPPGGPGFPGSPGPAASAVARLIGLGPDGRPRRAVPPRGTGLARGLGGLSLLLAAGPMALPGPLARAIGLRSTPGQRLATSAVGARELAVGVGLLAHPKRWMLVARCLGDAMDIALLASTLPGRPRDSRGRSRNGRSSGGPSRLADARHGGTAGIPRTAGALAAVSVITALDVAATAIFRSAGEPVVEAHAAVTIARDRHEIYRYWRDFEHLPEVMAHLDSVEVTGRETSHWVAKAPFGREVSWDARIVDEVPGERITWRSMDGATVSNEGVVHFFDAPGQRGTEVHVTLRYEAPAGRLGKALARYFGEEPHQALDDDLRRLKQVMETGEVVRSDGAPWGKTARREFPQRPAQPVRREQLLEEVAR